MTFNTSASGNPTAVRERLASEIDRIGRENPTNPDVQKVAQAGRTAVESVIEGATDQASISVSLSGSRSLTSAALQLSVNVSDPQAQAAQPPQSAPGSTTGR